MGISNLVDTLTDIKNMVDNMNENLKIFAKNQEFLIGGLQQVNGKNRGNHQNSQLSCCDVKDLSGILVNNNDNDVILGKKNGRNGRITDDKIDARHLFDEISMNKILRNDGTVQEYYDKFNLLFGDKGFDEWYLVDLFLWRLHPDIKKRISFFKPKSLSDAYCLAKCQEAANNIIKKKSNSNIPMSSCSKISKGVEKENNELAGYHECCEENVGVVDMVLANNNKGLVVMDKVCNEDGKGNDLESNESSKMDVDGVVNCEEDGKYHEIESSRVVNNNIGLNDLVEFSKEGDKDGKMASKDCISHQSGDCGLGSGIASPEFVSDILLCDNFEHGEKHIEGSWSSWASISVITGVTSGNTSSMEECPADLVTTLQEPEVGVSTFMLTAESGTKADISIAVIDSVELKNGQNVLKSSRSKMFRNIQKCSESEEIELFGYCSLDMGKSFEVDKKIRRKAKTPCIVFIGEIDVAGTQRGVGLGWGNDEREQTLHQLLTELDGFSGNKRVLNEGEVVLAEQVDKVSSNDEVKGNTLYMTGSFKEFNAENHETRSWDEQNAFANSPEYIWKWPRRKKANSHVNFKFKSRFWNFDMWMWPKRKKKKKKKGHV